jgi:ABC-2 type transport system permease protein
MTSLPVAWSLTQRSLVRLTRIPSVILPSVAMPIFFVIAFSGAFSALTRVPGFGTDEIASWMMPFALLQGAAFAGVGTSFATGMDLENGFFDRLLLAPSPRRALLFGSMLAASIRALIPFCLVVPVGFLAGAELADGPVGLLPLLVATEGVAMWAVLWGLGIFYRFRSLRAASLTQVGIFVTTFLSVGQVPLAIMTGWLHGVARVNPMTQVLDLAREGFVGGLSWGETWPGLVAIVGVTALLAVFAVRGLDRTVP